jgi:6-phosphogluconolactonase
MSKYQIFFGTYSKGEGNGLFRGEFDGETGKIKIIDSLGIENPAYLELNGGILYGVSETGGFEGENGGALFSVFVADNLKMRLIDMKCTHGKSPCHLCLKDNFIFVSNYSEGSLSIFKTDNSGSIESYQSIHHFGRSVNSNRQEASHIHFASMTPDDKYLAVCDLGLDKVFLYPYSKDGLSSKAKEAGCPPGSGPRHLTFSDDGKYMYVLTEMGNTVLVYDYDGENVKFLHELPNLPPDFSGISHAAAIHISKNGKLMGASNRGHDSVAIYDAEKKAVFKKHVTTGKEPRDFNFSPDNKYLLSADQNDDLVTIFKIEGDDFIKTGSISLPKPVCIIFGEEIN